MLFCRFFLTKNPEGIHVPIFCNKTIKFELKKWITSMFTKNNHFKNYKKIRLPHFYKKPRGSNLKEEEVQCLLQT